MSTDLQKTATDPSHCPLCGQPNQCAISAGLPAASCWCMQAPVSRDALERIPAAQRGTVCICPHCAQPVDRTGTPG